MASDSAAETVKPALSSRRNEWLFALVLLAVTLAVYFPAWFGKPLWDDDGHMTRQELRSWAGFWRIWAEPGATQQYYPLVHSVFWLEYKIWGDSTLGYHLINILLHVFCALLLLRILRLLEVPGAWLAAAIFALHPMEVESVAWISELKNTLSGAFYLGAALAYLRFDRSRERRLHLIALGLFSLGLFCKTVIATLPAALLVVFWWKRGKLSWKRDALPQLPFFILGIGMGLFTAYVEKNYVIGGDIVKFHFNVMQRCLIAGRAFWFYIGKLLWPAKLIFIYPRWNVSEDAWWQYLFPAAALALLAALWMLRKRTRGPLAAALFFGGTLFPALGFVNVYPFIYSFVADHFQYLAGIGIITLVAAGAAQLWQRLRALRKVAGLLFAAAVLMMLAALAWRQCGMYANARTLYTTTIHENPDCWMAYNNLGSILLQTGETDEAIADYLRALEIKPDLSQAHLSLGYAFQQKGQEDEAIVQFQKILEINPHSAEAHNDLGLALLKKGVVDEAITHFQMALDTEPAYAEARNNLGLALLQKGAVAEAIADFQMALEIKPGYAAAHYNLGLAFQQNGEVREAIAHYKKALEIEPGYAEARNNLGYTLLHEGQVDDAIVHFQKALELEPDLAEAHYNLGLALKEEGDMAGAIAQFQKALALKPDYAEAHYDLGLALQEKGQSVQAVIEYQKALDISPDMLDAHLNLGNILAQSGDVKGAITQFQKVLELKPDYAKAHYNLGYVLQHNGDAGGAIAHYEKALEIQPGYAPALNSLAYILATCPQASLRDGAKAFDLARQADKATGDRNPMVLQTLAAAYAETGHYSDAVDTAQRALDLAGSQPDPALADQLRSQIALYKADAPFRDNSLVAGWSGPDP